MLKRGLFALARSPLSGSFIGFAFTHLTPLMPIKKMVSDRHLVVFPHPVPHWQTHLLAVPKKRIPSLVACDLGDSAEIILSIFHHLTTCAQALQLNRFTILVNGGAYQDVPQLHFHLASGVDKQGQQWGQETFRQDGVEPAPYQHGLAQAQRHPAPTRETHWQIGPKTPLPCLARLEWAAPATQTVLLDMVELGQQIVREHNLTAFTLLTHAGDKHEHFSMHLVGGKSL